MNLNPYKYIIKRYYSKDLTPHEFKLMNIWLPFFLIELKLYMLLMILKKWWL